MPINNEFKDKLNYVMENPVMKRDYHEYVNKQYAKEGLLGEEAMEKASTEVIKGATRVCPFCNESTVKYKAGIFGYCYNCGKKVYIWQNKMIRTHI